MIALFGLSKISVLNSLITSPVSTPDFFARPFHLSVSIVILPSLSTRLTPYSSNE